MNIKSSSPQRFVLQCTHCCSSISDIIIRDHDKASMLTCSIQSSDAPILLQKIWVNDYIPKHISNNTEC